MKYHISSNNTRDKVLMNLTKSLLVSEHIC